MYYIDNYMLTMGEYCKAQKGETKNESKIPKIRNKFRPSAP